MTSKPSTLERLQALVDAVDGLNLDVPAQRGLAVIRLRGATADTALLFFIGLHTLEGAIAKLPRPPKADRVEQIVSAVEAMGVVDPKYLRRKISRR